MVFSSFYLVMFTALIVAVFGFYLVRMSHQKALQKKQMRKELLKRIEASPLPRLLLIRQPGGLGSCTTEHRVRGEDPWLCAPGFSPVCLCPLVRI